MRVIEYLAFRAELKGVPRGKRQGRVADVLDKARLTEVAHVLIGSLSKGYRQRVGLADALVADPPLLILDEPTAGLDPNQIREVREVVAGLRGSHTVLLSTHILSEVETSCGRAIVLAKGRLVAEGTVAELREKRVSRGVRVRLDGARDVILAALADIRSALPELAREPEIMVEDGLVTIELTWEKDAPIAFRDAQKTLAKTFVSKGLGLVSLEPLQGRLEDVFAELTLARAVPDRGEGDGPEDFSAPDERDDSDEPDEPADLSEPNERADSAESGEREP